MGWPAVASSPPAHGKGGGRWQSLAPIPTHGADAAGVAFGAMGALAKLGAALDAWCCFCGLASGAVVTVNADGSFDYDPNGAFDSLAEGQTATDSFTYTTTDGNETSDSATVTITVSGVDEEPVITAIGLYMGTILGGAILTETVFNRPGLGKLLVGAISQRDYNTVQSGLVVFAFIVVIVNLIVDLTYSLFDPKVKYE